MSRKISLRFILVLILILLILSLGFYLVTQLTDLDLGISLVKEESTAHSLIVLEEARDLFKLNTLEVVYKTVFPYDFIPQNYNWYLLLARSRDKRPLSPEDSRYLEIFNLARSLGINLAVRDYSFIVITCYVRIGFPISDAQSAGTIFNTDPETGRVEVYLPEPEITDFILEDPKRDTYGYPDIAINPEKWRLLSDYLRETIKEMVFTQDLIEQAKTNAKDFLTRFLEDAGFTQVDFPSAPLQLPL